MDTNELTVGQVKEIAALVRCEKTKSTIERPFAVGESVFIRTVTHYLTGKVEGYCGHFIELSDAAWIADTGRFMDFLKNGTANEVEPITGNWFVNLESTIDMGYWNHPLPGEQR